MSGIIMDSNCIPYRESTQWKEGGESVKTAECHPFLSLIGTILGSFIQFDRSMTLLHILFSLSVPCLTSYSSLIGILTFAMMNV